MSSQTSSLTNFHLPYERSGGRSPNKGLKHDDTLFLAGNWDDCNNPMVFLSQLARKQSKSYLHLVEITEMGTLMGETRPPIFTLRVQF